MKNLATVLMAAALAAGTAFAKSSTPKGWTDDYGAALKKAGAEGKLVLADFSGSDWCGWCKRLDREVFDTDEFRAGVKDKYVLLMVDSPQDKTLLTPKARKANPELCRKYGIRGYPTVLVLDDAGEVLLKTGYQEGGPGPYLKMLDDRLEGAADVARYIRPVAKPLAALDAEYEKACEALAKRANTLYPDPGKAASEEFRAKRAAEHDAWYAKNFRASIAPKFAPRYEKAVAAAKAAEVPAGVEARRAKIVADAEEKIAAMKGETGAKR